MAKQNLSPRDPNVLDLRRLLAERQAPPRRGHRQWPGSLSRLSSGQPPPKFGVGARPILHHPAETRRDWALFKRELLKFGLVLLLVGLVSAGAIVTTRLVTAKTDVERTTRIGLASMQNGLAALGQSHPAEATSQFAAAKSYFARAQRQLSTSAPAAADRVPLIGRQVKAGRALINAGVRLSDVGVRLSALLPADTSAQPAVTIQSDGIIQGSIGILSSLLQNRLKFISLVNDAVSSVSDLTAIDARDIPGQWRGQFSVWQKLVNGLVGAGDNLDHLTAFLLGILGSDQPREFLVVFQNNDELRPTGGFPGTYLLVQFERGSFKILDAPGNGPFALSDASAKVNLPPQPLLSIAPYWTFHDANWYLDLPTSAKTMLNFYAQDRGFTPDGMMFLTPGIIEDLLRVTGPVRPEHYQVDIRADNFVAATEQQVEFGYDKALNNPKQFLIDLVPLMLTKLSQLNGPDALRAMALTLKRANQGDLLVYSREPQLQKTITQLGWDGALLPVNGDYLAVVDTNLGGGKTDRVIDERVKTIITVDGSLLRHTVVVTRTHRGQSGLALSSATNRDFIRVYAPPDAQFVGITGATVPDAGFFMEPVGSAKMTADLLQNEGQTLVDQTNGYRLTGETGRQTFGAWSRIEPGQSQTVVFTYTTPAPNGSAYHLDWQHQPGAPLRTWQLVFNPQSGQKIASADPVGVVGPKDISVTFSTDSTVNRSFNVSFR